MKVNEYDINNFKDIQFGEETIIIMAHQNKIITINDHEELYKIKFVLEEIADSIKYSDDEKDFDKDHALRSLIDQFEEESWFLEDKEFDPRNLIVGKSEEDNYDSKISFHFGYLNSKDTFLEPKEYKIIAEHLLDFANNSGRCKDSTKELLTNFSNELLLEYKSYEENKSYFKVKVIKD